VFSASSEEGDTVRFMVLRTSTVSEGITAICVWSFPLIIAATFAWLISDIIFYGIGQISWEFLTAAPRQSGRAGGIAPILISTALIAAICMFVVTPVGLGTAILLAEYVTAQNRPARWVRLSLAVLAGIPSIVFGLFGNAFFCNTLKLGFSLLSGGLTLACMVLPIFVLAAEESLRGVPESYRRAAAALGMTKARVIVRVVLPLALPGLIGGFLLGIGRAMAETAALIFTSGYVDRLPSSLLDSGRALSVHIYDLSMNIPGGDSRAYASALVLVGLLAVLSGSLTFFATWSSGQRGIG
jgi:phosphate transport system permease protein